MEICPRCKHSIEEEEWFMARDGYVCEDCASKMVKCTNCRELVEEEEIERFGGEVMCSSCVKGIQRYETEQELKTWARRQSL